MGRKILIVEDNELNREILVDILSGEYEVVEAEDGSEAIRILEQRKDFFHVILLDIVMPKVDGFGVLDYMNQKGIIDYLPVIMITSDTSGDSLARAYDLGAAEYFTKPYNPSVVTSRIRNVITLFEKYNMDPVTRQMTRQGFISYVDNYVRCRAGFSDYAILYFNLKRFNVVNSVLGMEEGDELLRRVAEQLANSPLNPEGIARLSADNFVMLAEKKNVDLPYLIDHSTIAIEKKDRRFSVQMRCGIYEISEDEQLSTSDMISCATLAEHLIASNASCSYNIFNDAMRARYEERNSLIAELDEAIRRNDFLVYYQPVVDAQVKNIQSAEALVRWKHPTRGMISPGVFIPILEQEDKISCIDRYVLTHVIDAQQARLDRGMPVVPVSVNLSRIDFYDTELIRELRMRYPLEAIKRGLVRIEITESCYFALDDDTFNLINEIRDQGIAIMMDDFGSGYSNYENFIEYSFDYLKLDISFTRQIETNPKAQTVIRSMIDMCHQIGIFVVAEGVENERQADYLAGCYCDLLQGFYYYRPMPEEDYDTLLLNRTGSTSVMMPLDEQSLNTDCRITMNQLKEEMRILKRYNDAVSLMDEDRMHYYQVDADGQLIERREACSYKLGHSMRCEECLCSNALRKKTDSYGIRMLDGDAYQISVRYVEVEGSPRAIEVIHKIRDEKETDIAAMSLYDTIKDYEAKMYTDNMTGVMNRRFLEERLDHLGSVTAIALFDIDHFKEINDTMGHHVGDLAIKTFAEVLRRNVRGTDCVIRMGGDEFVILFRSMKKEYFERKLEEIRQNIQQAVIPGYPKLQLTATIGGYYCEGAFHPRMIKAADQALYIGKTRRNTVEIVRDGIS